MSRNDSHTALGPGGEFDIIRELVDEWGPVAAGIGDDAALLDVPLGHKLVVSTDATIEDVHFRRRWISPHETGARAATAALSDIAAMGAVPYGVLVSFIVPAVWREHLRTFAAGLRDSIGASGARIIGGNMARGGAFSCTLTVIGHAANPVLRSTAHAGDALFVTGRLGGPGAAVMAWVRSETPPDWARARFVHPVSRLAEGQWLAAEGATAMIDISDGLEADSLHLAAASGVHCDITPELVPRYPGVTAVEAVASGEEYELLVALPAARAAEVANAFEKRFGLALTQVGSVRAPDLATADLPSRVELRVGHDHFSGQ
jgi:thiamine-monophosphate kinase